MCAEMHGMAACFSAEEFRTASGGEWKDGTGCTGSLGCYTDTRKPGSGKIFIALCGEKFDGHDFLKQAVAAGAEALCIARSRAGKLPPEVKIPVLMVDDTLKAYQDLARFHRRRFSELKVVAVTGSVGKTSVKEMCRAVLSEFFGPDAVLYTEGNTNNQIGVPQNLLRLGAQHRAAVIEMGTSGPGEIAPLSACAEPQVALVNTIAPCHLEKLGSFYGIALEKSAIFDGLPENGAAVIPLECPANNVLLEHASKFHVTRFGHTGSEAEVRSEYLSGDLDGSRIAVEFPDGSRQEIEWKLTGEHQALNAAAASAVGLACGVPSLVIAAGLAHTSLPGMRMARSVIGGATWINDAYNANPASQLAAIRQLAAGNVPQESLVLVLGDMLELGTFEAAEHKKVLQEALNVLPNARMVTVGPRFARAASSLNAANVTLCGSAEGAGRILAKLVKAGDTVFLKGSRGIGLEKAIPKQES